MTDQLELTAALQEAVEGPVVPAGRFKADGATFDPILDAERLGREMQAVIWVMGEGGWYGLRDLLADCRRWACDPHAFSEAGLSARLRDLRKKRYGSQTIERRRKGSGWEYRWVRKL